MAYIRLNDRIGTTVNGFYIEDAKREGNRSYVYAICPYCKSKSWKRLDYIADNRNVSCGCYNKQNNYIKFVDLTNKKFGRLTAVRPIEKRAGNGSIIWECKCECGKTHHVSAYNLQRGSVRSCKCLGRENSSANGKINGQKIVDNYVIKGTNVNNLTAKIPKNNTSGVKGVHFRKDRGKWVAQIEFKGKHYCLGSYLEKENAIKARKTAEDNLFGNFLDWYAKEYPERWEKMRKKKGQ